MEIRIRNHSSLNGRASALAPTPVIWLPVYSEHFYLIFRAWDHDNELSVILLLIIFIAILQGLITTFCFGTMAARKASSAAFGFYSWEAILGQQLPHHHGTFRPQSRVCVDGIVFLLVYGRSGSPEFPSCLISSVSILPFWFTHIICIFPQDFCRPFCRKFAYRA